MKTVVYIADTDALRDPGCFAFFLDQIDEARRKKIEAFRQETHRIQSLAAGILLLKALKDCGEAVPEIACNAYGKPYFPAREDLHFSLSHSGRYAMCVLSDVQAGCDIEEVKSGRENVSKRFFAPDEQAYIASRHGRDRKEKAFFRIWTRKESYVKAKGTGLRFPLASFSAVPGESALPDNAVFYEYRKIPGYCVSVCLLTAEDRPRPVFRKTDISELYRLKERL